MSPLMTDGARRVQRTYLLLTLLSTLAASFIWGINTLFLLDAGLTNTEAFAANAFFTAGQVIFEVPTGVVADVRGRRVSYMLGAVTLLLSTLLYLLMWQTQAGFWDNKRLSEKRARAAMEYFIRKGIARARLSAVGYGPTRPAASNATKQGRAKNRRVELKPIR